MAINFKLLPRGEVPIHAGDSLGRAWVGWDDNVTLQGTWHVNRGQWNVSAERLARERRDIVRALDHSGSLPQRPHGVVRKVKGSEVILNFGAKGSGDPRSTVAATRAYGHRLSVKSRVVV